jgi:hypothetical protein
MRIAEGSQLTLGDNRKFTQTNSALLLPLARTLLLNCPVLVTFQT